MTVLHHHCALLLLALLLRFAFRFSLCRPVTELPIYAEFNAAGVACLQLYCSKWSVVTAQLLALTARLSPLTRFVLYQCSFLFGFIVVPGVSHPPFSTLFVSH